MPLTKEQIRNAPVAEGFISPNFGDGGWHTTPGCVRYTTEWEPRNDRILVRILAEPAGVMREGRIIAPEISLTQRGHTRVAEVLKVGPGKWIPGTWWSVKQTDGSRKWEWIPGYRQAPTVQRGQRVVLGMWSDWESLDASWGENIVICQEADIRAVI